MDRTSPWAVWTRMILGVLVLAAGLRAVPVLAQTSRPVNSVTAIVNGEIITNEEIRTSSKLALDTLKEQYSGEELEARARAVLGSRLNQLIEKKLLLHEAKAALTKEEIRKEQVDKDLDRVVKDLIDQAGSILQLKKLLASKGETLEQAKERRREEILIEEVLRRNVLPYVSVSPREIREFYRQHIEEFSQKKQVKFRQILIKFSEYETKDQARQVAESVLKKLKAGSSFESVAQEYSRDPYAKEGGLWGSGAFVGRGERERGSKGFGASRAAPRARARAHAPASIIFRKLATFSKSGASDAATAITSAWRAPPTPSSVSTAARCPATVAKSSG